MDIKSLLDKGFVDTSALILILEELNNKVTSLETNTAKNFSFNEVHLFVEVKTSLNETTVNKKYIDLNYEPIDMDSIYIIIEKEVNGILTGIVVPNSLIYSIEEKRLFFSDEFLFDNYRKLLVTYKY